MKKFIFIIFLETLFLGGYAQGTPVTFANPWELTGNAGTTDANFLGTTDNQSLIFRTNNVERMRLLSDSAKLGIGTPNPLATLHLHNEFRTGWGSTNETADLLLLTTSDSRQGGFSISLQRDNGVRIKQRETANIFIEGPGGGITIEGNGNVGVGILSPQEKLEVDGSFRAQSANITGTVTANDLNAQSATITGSTYLNGNVGIGTDVPRQRLHVVDGNILISKTSTRAPGSLNGSILFGDDVSNQFPFGQWGIEYLNIDSGCYGLNFWRPWNPGDNNGFNYSLFLNNNGNVGIGKNNPQAKLDVNGSLCAQSANITENIAAQSATITGNIAAQSATINGIVAINGTVNAKNANFDGSIKTKEINVTLAGWPDFVFDKDYKLMPLSAVEQFITGNKHLPGVPSEAEVVVNGVNVGEMNAILLQKVEELTLYVIELQKQIEELKK